MMRNPWADEIRVSKDACGEFEVLQWLLDLRDVSDFCYDSTVSGHRDSSWHLGDPTNRLYHHWECEACSLSCPIGPCMIASEGG